jgi:hypothetical protein
MIDATALERPNVANAYRALYLLPGAPRELIDAAYDMLARNGASPAVRAAYETIVSTLEPAQVEQFPRRLSPWHLLHLQPNAPQPLFAAAYHIWLGGNTPLESHTSDAMAAATFRSPPAVDPVELLPVPEAFLSAFEELEDDLDNVSSIDDVLEPAAAQEAHVFAFEEFARDERSSDLQVAATEAQQAPAVDEEPGPSTGSGSEIEGPTLMSSQGNAQPVTDRPLRIGTQPSCEVLVRAAGRFEARVWRNKGRVLVHAIGEAGAVLVNDESVTWAVLTDGDTLAVGPLLFTFDAG